MEKNPGSMYWMDTNLNAVVVGVSNNDLLVVPEAKAMRSVEHPLLAAQLAKLAADLHLVRAWRSRDGLAGSAAHAGGPRLAYLGVETGDRGLQGGRHARETVPRGRSRTVASLREGGVG